MTKATIAKTLAALALWTAAATAQARDSYVNVQPDSLRLSEVLAHGKKKKLRVAVGGSASNDQCP